MQQDLLQGKSGEVRVLARFAKRDNEAGDAPDWSEPREVTLAIERREKNLLRAKHRGQIAGDILTMNVRDFNWAEYGERDHDPGESVNKWLCEEYRMEILSLAEGANSEAAQPVAEPQRVKITLAITLSDDRVRELAASYGHTQSFIMDTPLPRLRELVVAEIQRRAQEFADDEGKWR